MNDDDQTYYDLLGVGADSSKDEIRNAYRARVEELRGGGEPSDADRAEIAQLNSAWSTLSDPFQRQRYDAGLSGTEVLDSDEDGDGDGEPVAAAERPRGLLGRLLTPPERASGGNGRREPPARPAATDPGPNWPPGFRPPPMAQRMIGFLVDFAVVAGLTILAFLVIVPAAQRDKVDALDEVNEQIDEKDEQVNDADDDIDRARDAGNADDEEEAENRKDRLEREKDDLEEQADDITADLQPTYLLASLGVLAVGLAYTVIPSRRNGQSPGKMLGKAKVIGIDGLPATTRALLLHYGVPIFVALAFIQFLGQLGVLIVLVAVIFKNRDKQGLHDRIARTLVVDASTSPQPTS